MTTTDEAEPLSRADKIAAAITEAIIASQGGHVDTSATLEALAEVAARIAFQTKVAITAADGREFAERHGEMIGRKLKALRKSRDMQPFAAWWESGSVWRQTRGKRAWTAMFFVAVDPHERSYRHP